MDSGIFFEVMKNIPDYLTAMNLCQAYPEICWKPDSGQWQRLIEERFGHRRLNESCDFQTQYLEILKRQPWVENIIMMARQDEEDWIPLKVNFLKHLDLLFSIVEPHVKQEILDFLADPNIDSREKIGITAHIHYDGDAEAYDLSVYNVDDCGDVATDKGLATGNMVQEEDLRNFLYQIPHDSS